MNLKTAARVLGVHYQTAYRYVRSGELVAVKVGGSYNISEGAMELLHQRLAALDAPRVSVRYEPPPSADDIDAELDQLIEAVTLTAQPVFDAVTRWLAVNVGDVCAMRLLSEDGVFAPVVSVFDSDPATRPVVEAFLGSWLMRADEGLARVAIGDGRPVTEHHLPAMQSFITVPARFLSYAEQLVLQSFVAVPLKTPVGRVIGSLLVARRHGAPPFPGDAVAILEGLAAKVVKGVERAGRFSAAWVARDSLHASIEALVALDAGVDVQDVSDTVLDLLDDSLAEAVFDTSGRLVAASPAFIERFGTGSVHLDGGDGGGICQPSCPQMNLDGSPSPLFAADGDFGSVDDGLCGGCGRPTGIHWAVVRRPDATPAAVVAVGEAAPPSPDDDVRQERVAERVPMSPREPGE